MSLFGTKQDYLAQNEAKYHIFIMNIYIHKNIKHLRRSVKMTQEELAERLGKTYTAVGSYENKKTSPPIPVILELCKIFKVDIRDFITKDLEVEEYQSTEEQPLDYEEMKDKLIALLEEKVERYEAEIRENHPDLAAKLRLG
jgi:transcriptional regulator with XRE-family HTH domain